MDLVFMGATDGQATFRGTADPRDRLRKGRIYRVERMVVHPSTTDIFLKGHPHIRFNSVCFAPAPSGLVGLVARLFPPVAFTLAATKEALRERMGRPSFEQRAAA